MAEGEFKIARCSNCSLVYLLNVPDESVIYEEYYKIEFTKKDYSESSGLNYLRDIYLINEQRLKHIKKLKPSGTMLDIGCGSGLFMHTAQKYGYDVSGIDVSRTAVDFARSQMEVNAEKKLLDEQAAENKRFDIITLWHVLEHFVNPLEELKKIHGLLKEDGLCLIEVPNFNSIKFKLSGRKWKGGNHPLYHRTFFTSGTLKAMLRKAGFKSPERLNISYKLPGKGAAYNISKDVFNLFAMDAFLDFSAKK
jgi:2-polyprenyl-3-methyl-5-hydroxy-6-metoxy-1,4-benzoquinol methylase